MRAFFSFSSVYHCVFFLLQTPRVPEARSVFGYSPEVLVLKRLKLSTFSPYPVAACVVQRLGSSGSPAAAGAAFDGASSTPFRPVGRLCLMYLCAFLICLGTCTLRQPMASAFDRRRAGGIEKMRHSIHQNPGLDKINQVIPQKG
jgi:hypothetical protein